MFCFGPLVNILNAYVEEIQEIFTYGSELGAPLKSTSTSWHLDVIWKVVSSGKGTYWQMSSKLLPLTLFIEKDLNRDSHVRYWFPAWPRSPACNTQVSQIHGEPDNSLLSDRHDPVLERTTYQRKFLRVGYWKGLYTGSQKLPKNRVEHLQNIFKEYTEAGCRDCFSILWSCTKTSLVAMLFGREFCFEQKTRWKQNYMNALQAAGIKPQMSTCGGLRVCRQTV